MGAVPWSSSGIDRVKGLCAPHMTRKIFKIWKFKKKYNFTSECIYGTMRYYTFDLFPFL